MTEPFTMSHKGFKAYDIRGVIPTEINEELAYRVGRAYAELYHPKMMCIGYDVRPSSMALCEAATKGLCDGGVDVYQIGLCGTDMVYFTTFFYHFDGGLMITASHNPADNNGIKIVREKAIPVSSDTGLKEIERAVFAGEFQESQEKGKVYQKEIMDDYVKTLLSFADIAKMKPLKIVVNGGNGCANVVFAHLKKYLPFEFIEMNMTPDGTFPNGVPNPMLEENRKVLIDKVLEEKADLGITWDGDFDRCFFIDHTGEFQEGYYMATLLGKYFLQKNKGEKMIHDPRVYWGIQDMAQKEGGIAVESKGGHSFMKETLRRVNGIFGAENSGHYFFRDYSYCDSGMIPWLIVTQIISETGQTLRDLLKEVKAAYPVSGEINLPAHDVEKVLYAVEEKYKKDAMEIHRIDGLGMDFKSWRFNLRASHTEPLIRFNMETKGDQILLQHKTKEMIDFIKAMN